jgi:hypothetical protein
MHAVRNTYFTIVFCVRGSIKYMFWIFHVSQLPVHAPSPDNREYTNKTNKQTNKQALKADNLYILSKLRVMPFIK